MKGIHSQIGKASVNPPDVSFNNLLHMCSRPKRAKIQQQMMFLCG
jgi:hypothetical protein